MMFQANLPLEDVRNFMHVTITSSHSKYVHFIKDTPTAILQTNWSEADDTLYQWQ